LQNHPAVDPDGDQSSKSVASGSRRRDLASIKPWRAALRRTLTP
jgi:hypothetical protein